MIWQAMLHQKTAEPALHYDVVGPALPSVHTLCDVVFFQKDSIFVADQPAALIAIENFRSAVPFKCFADSLQYVISLDVRFIWQEIYFSLILQVIEIRAVCIVAFILRVEVIAAIPIPSRAFLSLFFILGIVKAIAFTRYFYVFCTEHFVWRISDRALVSVTASNAAFQLNIFRQLVLQIRKRIVKWVMCSDGEDFFSLIIGFDGHRCDIIHIRFIKFDLKIKTLHFAISRNLNLLVNHFFPHFLCTHMVSELFIRPHEL